MVETGNDKNLVGGSTGGIFPGGGNEQTFSWWEGPLPIVRSRKTNIYIYTIVSAYVLIPVIISVSQGTEKLNTLPQAHKNP